MAYLFEEQEKPRRPACPTNPNPPRAGAQARGGEGATRVARLNNDAFVAEAPIRGVQAPEKIENGNGLALPALGMDLGLAGMDLGFAPRHASGHGMRFAARTSPAPPSPCGRPRVALGRP